MWHLLIVFTYPNTNLRNSEVKQVNQLHKSPQAKLEPEEPTLAETDCTTQVVKHKNC